MNKFSKIIKKVTLRLFAKRFSQFKGIKNVDSHQNLSNYLRERKLVLIGSRNAPKWLEFVCPSGCGEIVSLNLMRSYRPSWSIKLNKDNTVTVFPSIVTTSCKSHFWIRHNNIEWV